MLITCPGSGLPQSTRDWQSSPTAYITDIVDRSPTSGFPLTITSSVTSPQLSGYTSHRLILPSKATLRSLIIYLAQLLLRQSTEVSVHPQATDQTIAELIADGITDFLQYHTSNGMCKKEHKDAVDAVATAAVFSLPPCVSSLSV